MLSDLELVCADISVKKASNAANPLLPGKALLSSNLREGSAQLPSGSTWYHVEQCTSTNKVLSKWWQDRLVGPGAVLSADYQTQGQGRLGRTWTAPAGTGLLLSHIIGFSENAHTSDKVAIAGMICALAMHAALSEQFPAIAPYLAVKWPNDIYLRERKLGGVLGRFLGKRNRQFQCAIGIGVNLMVAPSQLPHSQAISLLQTELKLPSLSQLRAQILAAYLEQVDRRISELAAGGSHWRQEFTLHCLTTNAYLRALLPDGTQIIGTGGGIGERGQLLVNAKHAVQYCLTSADTTLLELKLTQDITSSGASFAHNFKEIY